MRKENAVLRESINDVAAEVARLTATLEGPGLRPSLPILDGDASRPAAAGRTADPRPGRRARKITGHARGPHSHYARRGAARCRFLNRASRAAPRSRNRTRRSACVGLIAFDVRRTGQVFAVPGGLSAQASPALA